MTILSGSADRRHRFSDELKKEVKIEEKDTKTAIHATRIGAHTFQTALLANSIRPAPPVRSLVSMTAFLRIDQCRGCQRSLPWEFVPAVVINGKTLAGTGCWRSQLVVGLCPACSAVKGVEQRKQERSAALRKDLIQLLGGEKPYREFTFENFEVVPENRAAYEAAKRFKPSCEGLYLWGASGVGKTHLAWAIVRTCFESGVSIAIQRACQISRNFRMKEPSDEQAAVLEMVDAEVLVIDDFGAGAVSAYTRQLVQEILDSRDFADKAGLIVTSRFSLEGLAAYLNDDSIPSRLAALCDVVTAGGRDRRLRRHGQ